MQQTLLRRKCWYFVAMVISKGYTCCAEVVDINYAGMTFEFERSIWNVEMLKFGKGYSAVKKCHQ
jgi:hypothetical protein